MSEIHKALAKVWGEVGYVQKQTSAKLNYSYAGEAALISALRPAMVKYGVVCFPTSVQSLAVDSYTTRNGAVMQRATVSITYTFAAQDGSSITVAAVGSGADTGDKSTNKAMTSAYKYALRQTFMIETGDDPDRTPSSEQEEARPDTKPEFITRVMTIDRYKDKPRNVAGAAIAKVLAKRDWPNDVAGQVELYMQVVNYADFRDAGEDGDSALDMVLNPAPAK